MPVTAKERLLVDTDKLTHILSSVPDDSDGHSYNSCIEQVSLILEDMNNVLDEVPDLNIEAQSGISSTIDKLFDIINTSYRMVHKSNASSNSTNTNPFKSLTPLLKELDARIYALDESVPTQVIQQLSLCVNNIMQLLSHANNYQDSDSYNDCYNQIYSITSNMCHLLEGDIEQNSHIVLPMVLKIHDIVRYKRHIVSTSNSIITAIQNLLTSKKLEYSHRSLMFTLTNNIGHKQPANIPISAITQLVDHLIDVAIESTGEDYEGLINIKLSWHNLYLIAEIADNDNLIISNYISINNLS